MNPNEPIKSDASLPSEPQVRSSELVSRLRELQKELETQKTMRDKLDQDDQWYHWHDGVAHGLHVAIEHLNELAANDPSSPTRPKGGAE